MYGRRYAPPINGRANSRLLYGALSIAVALAIGLLAACPAGGGAGATYRYLCANGAPVDGTTDVSSDTGRIRCQRCDLFYELQGAAGALGTSCRLSVALGEATRIGDVSQFGVSESVPTGLAAIGDTLYMVGDSTDALYTLNTTDGSATQVGSLSAGFGVSEGFPSGLAAIGATLYMVGWDTDALFALRYQ